MTEAQAIVRGKSVRYIAEEDDRARVDRADQIPAFPDEAAERAWWGEHTLSEEFWKNAEPVPDDELPPIRPPKLAIVAPATPVSQGGLSPGQAFVVGLAAGAGIVAGVWLLYQLLRTGKPAAAVGFGPTRVSHLSVFPPWPDVAALSRMVR